MRSNIAVYGLCKDQRGVEKAVESLRQQGFRNTDLSILFPGNVGSKDFAHEKHSKAPEGAFVGVIAGTLAGGFLGWLASAGLLAIPGNGPLIAAGSVIAALAGAGAGAIVGVIAGALIGMRVPEYEAKRYEGRVRDSGILVSVHCDNPEWVTRARDLLAETGVKDIAWAAEASADFLVTDRPLARPSEQRA
jgi:hypothetical protein